MADLILHHYPTSPFAEKVRAILGAKQLAWHSCPQPAVMPKPELQALTGGYRRIPVLQIGADVYCDTALICDVLEHLQPQPALYPAGVKGAARVMAQWADTTLFWAAMAYNFQPAALANIFPGQTPEQIKAFSDDRTQMRGGAPRMHPADAAVAYKSYLRRIASMVDDQPFVLGSQPTVADFACYHPLWFTRERAQMPAIFAPTPSIGRWMDRMAAFGHGSIAGKLSPDDALALARTATPAPMHDDTFQDEHGIALGSAVTLTAESFGLEPTAGDLIAATRTRYTLRRTDPRAGTVHVHFPRVGFKLRR
ncbi:MAG: glutathione S-transferase family protein, partial [Betaproteobacteria bacterium]|nr:glutathione S-transferase family protein [Betaproteobacteria bacterium]